MTTPTIFYYTFFSSLLNYDIITKGTAYKNNINFLQKVQLNYKKMQVCLLYCYEELRDTFLNNMFKTRNTCIQLPIPKKMISDKTSYVVVIKYFNIMPNDLKFLTGYKSSIKRKL